MPFFLPDELTGYRYLQNDADSDIGDEARRYSREIDLAFFIVNFGYTKADYLALTPRERAFVYRAWENKLVRDSQLNHDATMLAYCNANRKRGRKATPLWHRTGGAGVDVEEMQRLVHEEKRNNITGLLNRIRRR